MRHGSDEDDRQETEEGAQLPPREMMSLISTSPGSALGDLGVDPAADPAAPAGDAAGGAGDTTGAGLPRTPFAGDEMHTQEEPRNETISQTDTASAES